MFISKFFIFHISIAMKIFSFTSILSTTLAALAVFVLGGIGAQTFAAYDSAYYTGNFTPSGCTNPMNITPLS